MPSLGQFIATRRGEWERLEALLGRSEGNGLRRLSAGELDELGRGYRRLMSDVALAQRDFPEDQLTGWLNALAARMHLRLYRAPSATWRRVGGFFWYGLPRRFREAWVYLLVAAALLLLPTIGGYWAALSGERARLALVPEEMRTIMERGATWTQISAELRPAMAAVIFTNNIGVAFFAFSGGIWFGLGTAYTLVLNGIFLGAVFGAGTYYGVGHLLADFVSPHGYVELTCIVIAGAAGLMLGYALLRPGALRRQDAVVRAGRRALELVVGSAPLFILAGLVEGNISPSELPTEIKLVLGPALWVMMMAYLLLVGRTRSSRVA